MNNWTTTIPTEEGNYWFYGDVRGGLGSHWNRPDKKLDPMKPELIHVSVRKISNGNMFIGQGRFIPSRKFDINDTDRREGVVGYWKKIDIELPEDVEHIFDTTG